MPKPPSGDILVTISVGTYERMNDSKKEEQIKKLKQKVLKLQNIYKSDVKESYREAAQTQELILQYQSQIERLKELQSQNTSSMKFKVKNIVTGEIKEFAIAKIPDPANNIITDQSPLAQVLKDTKPNEQFKIGNEEYIKIAN